MSHSAEGLRTKGRPYLQPRELQMRHWIKADVQTWLTPSSGVARAVRDSRDVEAKVMGQRGSH